MPEIDMINMASKNFEALKLFIMNLHHRFKMSLVQNNLSAAFKLSISKHQKKYNDGELGILKTRQKGLPDTYMEIVN